MRLAVTHHRAGRLDEARALYARILAANPDQVDALNLLGVVHHRRGELDEAARLIARAVALKSDFAAAHANLGNVLRDQGKRDQAAAAFRQAIALQSDLVEAHNSLGTVLQAQGKLDEAEACYRAAIALRADYIDPLGNLGAVLQAQGRLGEAIECYRKALAIQADVPEILVNLGIVLNTLGRLDEAIAAYRRVIELRPDLPEVHNNLACAQRDLGQFEEAFASYRRALALRPSYPVAHSNLISAMDLAAGITAAEAQAERKRWYAAQRRTGAARFDDWPNPRDPERRLRLGYVSADFRRHAASYAVGPMLTGYDRARFEVTCYAAVAREDEVTARFKASVDRWRSTVGVSDDALVQQIRADGIDLLIDLAGHSPGNRLPVFTAKAAPLQITAWGHPTGTGIADIDALFADPILVPPSERPLFAETIVDLPCALSYEAPDYAPEPTAPPMLAAGHVTFGCFNRFAKVSDPTIALWARVLRELPTSRLLLKDKLFSHADERGRALERMARLGIPQDRVVFQGATDHSAHMAAYGAMDIALDPFPQNGGITTLESLWMGVPVVTRLGATPLGRLGGSILTALGLGAFVAADDDGYVAIARRWAQDRDGLAAVRAGLRPRMRGSPVGDVARYVATVEQAYRTMWRRWCAGTGPAGSGPDEQTAHQHELEGALAHHGAGRLAEAVTIYRAVLARDPTNVDALHLLGVAQRQLGDLEEAARCIARAVALKPDFDIAYNNLGNVLRDLGRFTEAEAAYRRAIALQPDAAGTYTNLGSLLAQQFRFADATAVLERALALAPDIADAHNSLGVVLWRQGKLDPAVRAFRRAIELEPRVARPHNNLGLALFDQDALDQSMESYRTALALKPDYADAHSNLIFSMDSNPRVTAADAQAERKRWHAAHRRRRGDAAPWPNAPDPERRLRIGYVSADFRRHSVAYCFGPVLWGHDHSSFEVICYSNGIGGDDFTPRFKDAADVWRPIAHVSDDALERMIRADAIDLLIDLSGHTAGNRLPVFTTKPAPVQLTGWGNASGTGLPEIDYLLADPVVVPAEERSLYVERILDLPCALSLPMPDEMPEPGPLPATTSGHVTFGCLNRFSKVGDEAIALWARILRDCAHSRLLLKDRVFSDPDQRGRALARLQRLGIPEDRLVILGATDRRAHLETYRTVDLALDPFPQNGGITSLEALWMGVPMVTRLGHTIAGRMTASILSALGKADLIARSGDDYVALALDRAGRLDQLATTRATLRRRMQDSPVGNPALYVAAVERAYRAAWRRWCARA